MGAAFDAMCENEYLDSRIKSKNKQIREQKKLIKELAEAYKDLYEDDERFDPKDKIQSPMYLKVINLLEVKKQKK